MANKGLFASTVGRILPTATVFNREGAPAYSYGPEHKLAQLAATGTLQDNFYSAAQVQLAEVLRRRVGARHSPRSRQAAYSG